MPIPATREHRKFGRHDFASKVSLSWLDEKGIPRQQIGRTCDLSEGGFSVKIERPFRIRGIVQFQIENLQFKGSACVRWCTSYKLSYLAGLEFVGQAWVRRS